MYPRINLFTQLCYRHFKFHQSMASSYTNGPQNLLQQCYMKFSLLHTLSGNRALARLGHHTVMVWLICRHRYFGLGFCTYMKVILTKKLTFITIIYHTQFQFAKMSGTLGNWHFLSIFLVKKSHRYSKNIFFS